MKKRDVSTAGKAGPTTNYPMDGHKDFCRRCLKYHGGRCPAAKSGAVSGNCSL